MDVSNPASPVQVERRGVPGHVHHIVGAGGTIYAACGDGGLAIYELSEQGQLL